MHGVEVFRTDIATKEAADVVRERLSRLLPGARIDVDTEDCDRVLRICSDTLPVQLIRKTVKDMGFLCEVLE